MTEVAAPSGQGDACASSADCTSEEYDTCQPVEGSDGYCTRTDCAEADDCGGDFYCATGEDEQTFCKRMPTGVGEACTTDADCADFDADYCIAGTACVVANCTDDSCPPGYSCIEVSPAFPKICSEPL